MEEIQCSMLFRVAIWAFIGSTLGFFLLRNKTEWGISKKIKEYILSVAVGIFFALAAFAVCVELKKYSILLSTLIAGTLAFFITELILQKFKEILTQNFGSFLSNFIHNLINKGK